MPDSNTKLKLYNFLKSCESCFYDELLDLTGDNTIKKVLFEHPELCLKILDLGIPQAQTIQKMVLNEDSNLDVNELHEMCYKKFMEFKERYYKFKIEKFVSKLDFIDKSTSNKLKEKMLEPVSVNSIRYSNFMEEASRRISQAIQPISGNLAELAVKRELIKIGLIEGLDFDMKPDKRTDIAVYHKRNKQIKHKAEVKNVPLRERATRGLSFDGDSLIGFFNQPQEFTSGENGNIEHIERHCKKSGGFCYVPPETLKNIGGRSKYIRSNKEFAQDMLKFVKDRKIT